MGLFFKDDEDVEVKKTKKETPSVQSTTVSTKPSSLSSLTMPQAPVISAAEKNEFFELLNSIYQKGNFPGPDYQEYTDALKQVEGVMDEKTKFSTIFIGFKVQGVTKARLLDTGKKYIDMISAQKVEFDKEIETIMKSEVSDKQKRVDAIAKENAEIEKQMILLNEKKNKNAEIAQSLTNEIQEDVSSLTTKKSSFEAAATEFVSNIQNTMEKINLYLS
jgi:cell division protein FtsB